MYALVRIDACADAKRAAASDDVAEFDRIHSEQPGFLGSLMGDPGERRAAIVNLCQSEPHATAAVPVVGPAVERLLGPLLAQPSRLAGTGEVLRDAELLHGSP